MGSNYDLSYNVDLVFCIDCTGSMAGFLEKIKNNALSLHENFIAVMNKKGKRVDKLRIRVICFRDYMESMKDKTAPMLSTEFFTLPQDAEKYYNCVRGLVAEGGGDDPEDALEALAFAVRSPWEETGVKSRHIIVMYTDNEPHNLGFAKSCPDYPEGMPKDLPELASWWGEGSQSGGYMSSLRSKRLLLFAPDGGAWKTISDNWRNVLHYTVKLDNGIQETDYTTILDALANSI